VKDWVGAEKTVFVLVGKIGRRVGGSTRGGAGKKRVNSGSRVKGARNPAAGRMWGLRRSEVQEKLQGRFSDANTRLAGISSSIPNIVLEVEGSWTFRTEGPERDSGRPGRKVISPGSGRSDTSLRYKVKLEELCGERAKQPVREKKEVRSRDNSRLSLPAVRLCHTGYQRSKERGENKSQSGRS